MTGGERRVNGRTGPTVPTPGAGGPGAQAGTGPRPRASHSPGPAAGTRDAGRTPKAAESERATCHWSGVGAAFRPQHLPGHPPSRSQTSAGAGHCRTHGPPRNRPPGPSEAPPSSRGTGMGRRGPKGRGSWGLALGAIRGGQGTPQWLTLHWPREAESHMARSRGDKSRTTALEEPSEKGN